MQLAELINGIDGARLISGAAGGLVNGLTADSREVRAGHLFAAFPSSAKSGRDGRDFIDTAVKSGARGILVPKGTVLPAGFPADVAVIEADQPRKVFAKMAAAFYGAQVETIVAVTGTNGKSTVVNFCRQIWQSMEHAAASLGTIGITANLKDGSILTRTGLLTTPDPVTLHSEIAELEKAGVTHLAMEASSQGLDQCRLDGVKVTAAAFTNLTRDHLDYHGDMKSYGAAKARLFTEILEADGIAILNRDIPEFAELEKQCSARGIRVITFGGRGADIALIKQKPLPAGQFIELSIFGDTYALELPLVGDFQAYNALTALGLVIAADPDNRLLHMQAVYALEKLTSVRGRLELAGTLPNGAAVYVDYAHTPDGLEVMLKAIKPHTAGKLHVVFGCGGDRDKGKRPQMGKISATLGDVVIVTDDNPRTEDAATIRAEVLAGIPAGKASEIGDRRAAIAQAVAGLGAGDILVVAGKGHEQGQIVGKNVLPFDDVSEVKRAIEQVAASQRPAAKGVSDDKNKTGKPPVDPRGDRKGP